MDETLVSSTPSLRTSSRPWRSRAALGSRSEDLLWVGGFAVASLVTVWSHWKQWQVISPSASLAYSFIGLGWYGTAWLLWHQQGQRSNARLFLLLSLIWIVGEVARLDIPVIYQITLFIAQFSVILCASLLMRYPLSRLDRFGRVYLISGMALTLACALPMALLATGPGVPTSAPGRVLDSIGPYRYNDVERLRWGVWAVYMVLAVILIVAHWRRLAAFERKVLAPIVLAAMIAAIGIASGVLDSSLSRPVGDSLSLARGMAGVGVSVAFLASATRLRRARSTVADLVERLNGPVTEASVQTALVELFGDKSIQVQPWNPDKPATAPAGFFSMPIPGNRTQPLAVVWFPNLMQRHASLLRSHLAACGMALENTRQLDELHEARARLVQVGLAERRRLERDLHDGAQQRLLALGMGLGMLEARAAESGTADEIRALRSQLRQAQQELRDLAHGIYPTVLTQAGLGPALESVVERLAVPITLKVPARRWPPDIESSLYLLACEALANIVKHAGPCCATVEVSSASEHVQLMVRDDGAGFSPDGEAVRGRRLLGTVTDRVTALGGEVQVSSAPGVGTTITAWVPLTHGDGIETYPGVNPRA